MAARRVPSRARGGTGGAWHLGGALSRAEHGWAEWAIEESGPRGAHGQEYGLLCGGLLIGWSSGAEKVASVAPFFIEPFKGVLCLFLLELGMVAARRMEDLKNAGWRLILLGSLLPLVHGALGVFGGQLAGMSVGGAAVFGAVVGSASYIAAPAAVRISLPKASPGIYLTMALGVTFPVNLGIGIPLFIALSQYLAS